MNPRNQASRTRTARERPRLQREEVVETAIATADRDGLDAVTIRRLAQELGVTPMALYWHFADKDALLLAMATRLWDDVAAEFAASPPVGDAWEQLTTITEVVLAELRRHPPCAELAPLGVLACRSGLDITEKALTLFAEEGLTPDRAADLAHFLLSTCMTLVSSQPGGPVTGPEDETEAKARKRAMADLPRDRYPHLVDAAPYFIECPDDDEYYRRGADFLIGGIRHQAEAESHSG